MRFSIYRYDPDKDAAPRMQTYEVDVEKNGLVMLLDALLYIKNTLDPTLALRRSCGEGVCGSDGMNIQGKNGLACMTPLSRLPEHVTIRPLPGQPVIRDLVVDLSTFYAQYKKVKPYLITNVEPAQEHLQSPQERAKLDGLYECILCACCSSACPSYWWNPEKFVGPAGLLQAARFIQDSRDTAKQERLQDLNDAYSVFRCRSIMNCADVCPKGLNPSAAIAGIRDAMMDN